MKYKIEIKFEKTAASAKKHIPNYSGQFPVWDSEVDADYARDFMRRHRDTAADYFSKPDEFTTSYKRYNSYILHGNGGLSLLNSGHVDHIDNVTQDIALKYESDRRRTRYRNNAENYHEAYELIHHLFDGGIRVYLEGDDLYLTSYQIPTDEQLAMIQEICDHNDVTSIEISMFLYKNNRTVEYFEDCYSFEEFKNFVLSLRYKHETADQDSLRRVQLLQSFRGDSELPQNRTLNTLGEKPKPASELGAKLTKEEIQSVLEKYPPLRNMERSARNRAIIRIADYFDSNNCYQQSDWVMEMLSGHLA